MSLYLRSSILIVIFFIPNLLLAIDCDSWIKHLALEHHVSIIKKSEIKNSNFRYFELSNSAYRIAIPQNEARDWNIETRDTPAGATFVAYNQAFGYSAEFDKSGNCVNSTGFSYSNMERGVPKSLDGRNLEFNYDWKACEKVSEVSKKKPFLISAKDFNEAASILKKSASKEYDTLEQIAKSAGNSPIRNVLSSSVASLLSKCIHQTKYLEATIKGPTKTKDPSIRAVQ